MKNMAQNRKKQKIRKGVLIFSALILAMVLTGITFAVSPSSSEPINIVNWESTALIGVFVVMVVAVFIYMLSRFMFNTRVEAWAKMQIYEAILSFILLLIFVWISAYFFTNPVPSFQQMHLVPNQCTGVSDLFTLSACDLSTFNSDIETYLQIFFWSSTLLSLTPGVEVNIGFGALSKGKLGNVGISAGLESLMPKSDTEFISIFFSSILFMLVLNQMQLMIVSSSLLFLSLFMAIGLISRIFGVTRTFGGAMIALGVGLGLILPLLTALTYGFLTVQIGTVTPVSVILQIISAMDGIWLTIGSNLIGLQNIFISGQFAMGIGYIIGGLTFVPFLNFIILDAFIIDFSSAIGERMDFMSLLAGVI